MRRRDTKQNAVGTPVVTISLDSTQRKRAPADGSGNEERTRTFTARACLLHLRRSVVRDSFYAVLDGMTGGRSGRAFVDLLGESSCVIPVVYVCATFETWICFNAGNRNQPDGLAAETKNHAKRCFMSVFIMLVSVE